MKHFFLALLLSGLSQAAPDAREVATIYGAGTVIFATLAAVPMAPVVYFLGKTQRGVCPPHSNALSNFTHACSLIGHTASTSVVSVGSQVVGLVGGAAVYILAKCVECVCCFGDEGAPQKMAVGIVGLGTTLSIATALGTDIALWARWNDFQSTVGNFKVGRHGPQNFVLGGTIANGLFQAVPPLVFLAGVAFHSFMAFRSRFFPETYPFVHTAVHPGHHPV